MASLASFMRFDRFFRCDTTKPPAGKNGGVLLKVSPKVFVLHFCVKKDFWIGYFPQKI